MRLQITVASSLMLIASLVYSNSIFASELTHPIQCHSLTASGNFEYPPFLWRETNTVEKDLKGTNRIILDEVSRRIGIPIYLTYVGPWSRTQIEVNNGRVDILAGVFYTNERANYMDYFAPFLWHTKSVVWQRKRDGFQFNGKEDLVGKWGVTVINNSFGQAFDKYAETSLNILEVASLSQAFEMLATDRVDYVLYEKVPGDSYLAMMGLTGRIGSVRPYIGSEGLFFSMSKKSACNTQSIKKAIAIALRDMRQDGSIERALQDGISEWSRYSNR